MKSTTTIKEVAQMAGVSPAAVSRYMNGGSLSDEKKERIKHIIKVTGYRPNTMAQTMRTGRYNQIGVIVPKINSDSVSQVTEGITQILREKNYIPMLGCTDSVEERELSYLEIMKDNQAAGIILMGTMATPQKLDQIRDCGIPVVVTGQNFDGVPCVFHDDFNALKDLTLHMIHRGHRRIGYLGVTEKDTAAGLLRRKGVQQALKEEGLDPQAMPSLLCRFDSDSGYEQMKRLLELQPDLDGVICATDRIALGAMAALHEAGKSIPNEIGIAGVGNSWAGITSTPGLTSVHLYYKQCGIDAAEMLLRLIEEKENDAQEDVPIRKTMLGYEIIERGST